MDKTSMIEALERADAQYIRAVRAVRFAESRDLRSLTAEDALRGHRDNTHAELSRIRSLFHY
jgi:hypothetical protein